MGKKYISYEDNDTGLSTADEKFLRLNRKVVNSKM